jgi:hypothetical protein
VDPTYPAAGDAPSDGASDSTQEMTVAAPSGPVLLEPPFAGSRTSGRPIDPAILMRAIMLFFIQGEPELGHPLGRWLAISLAQPGPPAGTTSPSGPQQSPVPTTPPVPPMPGGMVGASGISSSVLLLSSFTALLVLFSAACRRFTRRLDAVSASWRPTPFLSLLERPG